FLGEGSAAGKDMLLASALRWPQGNGLMLPVDEILAAKMAPMHMAPCIAIGIELVEQVKRPLVKDRAVWVVVPVGRWLEVIDRTVWVVLHFRSRGLETCLGTLKQLFALVGTTVTSDEEKEHDTGHRTDHGSGLDGKVLEGCLESQQLALDSD